MSCKFNVNFFEMHICDIHSHNVMFDGTVDNMIHLQYL